MRNLVPLVAAIAAMMSLAGCVAPNSGEHTTDPLTLSSFRLFAPEAPTEVYPGFPVTFTMTIEGPQVMSDHIGAHIWSDAPADPTAGIGDGFGCQHVSTPTLMPGEHEVTCTFPEPGNWTLHGHARVEDNGNTLDYWTVARHVVVHEPYTLSVANPPSQARAGGSTLFVMDVNGDEGISTHLGGHYWTEAPADPTAAIGDAWGCIHPEGQSRLPGTFSVECAFDDAGEYTVRGHMRMELDGRQFDFWSEPFQVTAE